MPSTLCNLFTPFENRVEVNRHFANFGETTFGTLKNIELNGVEMARMILTIEEIEEKLNVDMKKFCKSTETWEESKKKLEVVFNSHKRGFLNLGAWIDCQAKSHIKNPVFYHLGLQLKELLDLDPVQDNETIGNFIDQIEPKISRFDFLKILRAAAGVSSNIVDYSVPLHLHMTILLLPVHQFLSTNDPGIFVSALTSHLHEAPHRDYHTDPNKNLYRRHSAVNGGAGAKNSESPLSEGEEVAMCLLRKPFFVNRTWALTRIIKDKLGCKASDAKKKTKEFINQLHNSPHGSLFLVSGEMCKINLQKLPEIRIWLTTTYYTSMETLYGITFPSDQIPAMRLQVLRSFRTAFESLTTWELGTQILRGLFPLRVNTTGFGNLRASQWMNPNMYRNPQSPGLYSIPMSPSSTNHQGSSNGPYTNFGHNPGNNNMQFSSQTGSPTFFDPVNHVGHHMHGNYTFDNHNVSGGYPRHALASPQLGTWSSPNYPMPRNVISENSNLHAGSSAHVQKSPQAGIRTPSNHQTIGNNTFHDDNVTHDHPRRDLTLSQLNSHGSHANSIRCDECKKAMELLSSHSAGCHQNQTVDSDLFPSSPFPSDMLAQSSSSNVGSSGSSFNPTSIWSPSNLFTDQADAEYDRITASVPANDFSSSHRGSAENTSSSSNFTNGVDFLHSDVPVGPSPAVPTDNIPGPSHSASYPLGLTHSPPMYLVPRDSNAPRYELVPVGPAPAKNEDHQAEDMNDFPIDGDINYNGNDYFLSL